ncbi:hypothetical protein, partial [Neisseria gonorrhoeae]|uniref:hypothetical protein n=1 Tax=Neisseria gonorrhoeae TaxID=485 RepID=UPI001B7FBA0A
MGKIVAPKKPNRHIRIIIALRSLAFLSDLREKIPRRRGNKEINQHKAESAPREGEAVSVTRKDSTRQRAIEHLDIIKR